MTKKTQEELEQVAKIYEQIRFDNPPNLQSILAVSSSTNQPKKNYPWKLNNTEIEDRFVWEDVIDQKKQQISENILITAEKAKAVKIKQSEGGDLYQFRGSDEWITLEDYSDTLLHQPFEDQLTHLFRFLLVEEFMNEDSESKPKEFEDHEELLKRIYFNKKEGFPTKFIFKKAFSSDYSLLVWKDKGWFEFDAACNDLEILSLKNLIDSGNLLKNLKNKLYFDGLITSLVDAIFESIKGFQNPFAEFEVISFYLIPFEGIVSFTLILEKLEKLGYQNKEFLLSLTSIDEKLFYKKEAMRLLCNFLKDHNSKVEMDSLDLRTLLIEAGKTTKKIESSEEQFFMKGLEILMNLESKSFKHPDNVIALKNITNNTDNNAYSSFLPWWHVSSDKDLILENYENYKLAADERVSKSLTKNIKFYLKSYNLFLNAFIPMKMLEDHGLKLGGLALNTTEEITLDKRKRKVWKEIDKTILNAYQYRISRSALSLKLKVIIKSNKPLLDKASTRLEQLLDLYESNIINN